jgi:uncharacterized membrane-anchored protein YjiN (DUF445 family)
MEMGEPKSTPSRTAPATAALDERDLARLRELKRMKLLAGGVLIASLAVLVVAKLLERRSPTFGFLSAFAEAATIGGLADWYAVVVLFKRPLGLPIPHTAIIPANHHRIAERLGGFIETHFLAPDPIRAKLRQVDFAGAASEWLRDPEQSEGLARFILRLLPEALTGAERSGLHGLVDQIEAVEVAPLAAELMTTFTEDRRHQRILDEVLLALNRLMTDPVTLDAIRQKIRAELPTLLNLYRADKFLLKKIATSAFTFLEEVRADEHHPLGSSLHSSRKSPARPNMQQSSRRLRATCSRIGASATLRRGCGTAFAALLSKAPAARARCLVGIYERFSSKPAVSLPTSRDFAHTSIAA